MEIKGRKIGEGKPAFIIAEIGINHNGDVDEARKLIWDAADARADAVKFQKRTLPDAIPSHMRDKPKETPWGPMSYLEYKERMEFHNEAYEDLAAEAHNLGLLIGVSVWDVSAAYAAANLGCFDFLKIPSALMSNSDVVATVSMTKLPFFWSTGMHDWNEVQTTRRWLGELEAENWGVFQCNASYPASNSELDLRVIKSWKEGLTFRNYPVGYSGHETGLAPTVAAVAIGADMVERHLTRDRAQWGSDHAASVEPQGFRRLVTDIRVVERALGHHEKKFYDSERVKRESLT